VCLATGNATGWIRTAALRLAEPLATLVLQGSLVQRTTSPKIANSRVQLRSALSGLPLPAPPTLRSAVSGGGLGLHPDRGGQSGDERRPEPECRRQLLPNDALRYVLPEIQQTDASVLLERKRVKTHTRAPIKGPQRTYHGSKAIGRLWDCDALYSKTALLCPGDDVRGCP
jgi:hypothetical protein